MTTSGASCLLDELLESLPDVPGEELRILDPVELGVLDGARDRLLRDLEAPYSSRVAGERQPDRAGPAVEIEDVLGSGESGEVACQLVQPLRHLGVRLQERGRAHTEAQPEDLFLDRLLAPEQLRREIGLLRRGVVDRPVDRAHLREAPENVDEVPRLESVARRGDEDDERLARVPPFPDDKVPEVPLPRRLIVWLQTFLARPCYEQRAEWRCPGRW